MADTTLPAEVRLFTLQHDAAKKLKETRSNSFSEMARMLCPNSPSSYGATESTPNSTFLFDSTGVRSVNTLASFLLSVDTNPTQRWFELEPIEEHLSADQSIRAWLQEAERRCFNIFNDPTRSFYPNMFTLFRDKVIYGTAFMMIAPNAEGKLQFYNFPINECSINVDHEKKVNAVFRDFDLTATQIRTMFPKAKLPEKYIKEIEKGETSKHRIVHGVYRRSTYDIRSKHKTKKKFVSMYIIKEGSIKLKEGGFDHFPWISTRWDIMSGEVWGRGPGESALGDLRMVQEIAMNVLEASQLAVSGPLAIPADMFEADISRDRDAINFYDPNLPITEIKRLIPPGDIRAGADMLVLSRENIQKAFFIDKLDANQKAAEMREVEVLQNQENQMRDMAPQLVRNFAEVVQPIVHLTLVMEVMKDKAFKESMPEALRGRQIKVRAQSPLTRAQKMLDVAQISRVLTQFMIPMSDRLPEIMDSVSGEKLGKFLLEVTNLPTDTLNTDEEIQAKKEQRAKQQQQAQMLQAAESGSQSFKNTATGQAALTKAGQSQGGLF